MRKDFYGAGTDGPDPVRALLSNLISNNQIEASLYPKWDVKRGLRNANGSGVVVGLTRVGDVQGYEVRGGEKAAVDGKLYYRGIDVDDLVRNCLKEDRFGYEETAYLLLFGNLPDLGQLRAFESLLGQKRELPDGFIRDMILTAPSRSIMNKLARSVLALYSYDDNPDDVSIENVLRQSIGLIAYFPALISSAYQAKQTFYNGESLHLHYPDPALSTAQNILHLTRPYSEFTDFEAKLLDLCMILHAEHGGGNNSSFTTHVVTSTGTDTYSAVAAAVGSLKGPKHGGANIEVIEMIRDIKDHVKDVTDEKAVRAYLIRILKGEANDRSGLIYGIGHAVYTVSDPRAALLKGMARKLAEQKGLLDDFTLYTYIEEQAPLLYQEVKGGNKLMPANVDLYSGFVYKALDIPDELATPIFAAARISGWCAHRIEELIAGGRIMRPAYKSVQPLAAYVPLAGRHPQSEQGVTG
ncbi:MAG: citrate/2-methylcitrate synthase [Clostridiales Family XIII bacterium]|jgi:citrate synthase|nr:citrate/2-methylcitrate synthase [Clostridiales Family XIII bacterium]